MNHVQLIKVVEFGVIDKSETAFVRNVLTRLLTKCTKEKLLEIFRNITTSSQHKLFSDGLQVFVQMVMKRSQSKTGDKALLSKIDFLASMWDEELSVVRI